MRASVRRATVGDAPALALLRYEFRASIGAAREPRTAFCRRCTRWMAARLGRGGTWACWVAVRGDRVVGTLWVQLIEKIPNPVREPEKHAYVTNAYVRPDLRGQGVGARLIRTALRWCRGRAVDAVILWPTGRSRSLYNRHGFARPRDILAQRLLPAGLDRPGRAARPAGRGR